MVRSISRAVVVAAAAAALTLALVVAGVGTPAARAAPASTAPAQVSSTSPICNGTLCFLVCSAITMVVPAPPWCYPFLGR